MATITDAQFQKVLDTFNKSQQDIANQDNLLTKTGDVTIKLADGTTKTVPSWAKMAANNAASAVRIAAGTNLNTLDGTKAGWYFQDHADQATTPLNYPSGHSGALQVVNTGNYQKSCYQLYYVTDTHQIYLRRYLASSTTAGSWTTWTTIPVAYPAADKTSKNLAEFMRACKARGSGFVRSSPPSGGSLNIGGRGFVKGSGFYSNVEDTHALMMVSYDSGAVGVVMGDNTNVANGTCKENVLYGTLNPPPGLQYIDLPEINLTTNPNYIKIARIKVSGSEESQAQFLIANSSPFGADATASTASITSISGRGLSGTASAASAATTTDNVHKIAMTQAIHGTIDANQFCIGVQDVKETTANANQGKVIAYDIFIVCGSYMRDWRIYWLTGESPNVIKETAPKIITSGLTKVVKSKPYSGVDGLSGGMVNGDIAASNSLISWNGTHSMRADPTGTSTGSIIPAGAIISRFDTRGRGHWERKEGNVVKEKGDYSYGSMQLWFEELQGTNHKGVIGVLGYTSPPAWFHFNNDGNIDSGYFGRVAFQTVSDVRIKENIQDMEPEESLKNILKMRPRSFVFKADKDKIPRRGFVAQELETIDPEYVHYTQRLKQKILAEYDDKGNMIKPGKDITEEVLTLDTAPMLLDTMISIQALHKEIQTLKTELADLKSLFNLETI